MKQCGHNLDCRSNLVATELYEAYSKGESNEFGHH